MTVQQWSLEIHHLAGHDGPAEGCRECTALRLECQGRTRYEHGTEAADWIRELTDRRKVAPPLVAVDCRWCGFWHVRPLRYPIPGPDPVPAVVDTPLLRGGRRWLMRMFHRA